MQRWVGAAVAAMFLNAAVATEPEELNDQILIEDGALAMNLLESRGIETSSARLTGDRIIVDGDIALYLDDLLAVSEPIPSHSKGRKSRYQISSRYQRSIMVVIHPNVRGNPRLAQFHDYWRPLVQQAISEWNNASTTLSNGRRQYTNLRLTLGDWEDADWYATKIQIIPTRSDDDGNLADFPYRLRNGRVKPGRYVRLTPDADNILGTRPIAVAIHELGHALGFWHSEDCDESDDHASHIDGTWNWCRRGPYQSIMAWGGLGLPGLSQQDEHAAVMLYPGAIRR